MKAKKEAALIFAALHSSSFSEHGFSHAVSRLQNAAALAAEARRRKAWKVICMAVPFVCAAVLAPRVSSAAQLAPATARAFDQYTQAKEERSNRDLAAKRHFLYIDALPLPEKIQSYTKLNVGRILVNRDEECSTPACISIPGGLIHDWIGIVFVPGISIPQALAILQDYDRDANYYPPKS